MNFVLQLSLSPFIMQSKEHTDYKLDQLRLDSQQEM